MSAERDRLTPDSLQVTEPGFLPCVLLHPFQFWPRMPIPFMPVRPTCQFLPCQFARHPTPPCQFAPHASSPPPLPFGHPPMPVPPPPPQCQFAPYQLWLHVPVRPVPVRSNSWTLDRSEKTWRAYSRLCVGHDTTGVTLTVKTRGHSKDTDTDCTVPR